ncbi:MAG: LOG family protein [Aggregatilineales bacterium]
MKVVAVFGGAGVQPGSDVYEQSYLVGKTVAEAGCAVMTGGYGGVMGAASQGASEAGGHVIGVTVASFSIQGERNVNQWITEEIEYPDLRPRLHYLVDKADAYIVMPGGVGTLQEIAEVWQQMRTGDIVGRPLIGYGDFWKTTLAEFRKSPYIPQHQRDVMQFVDNSDDLLTILEAIKETV